MYNAPSVDHPVGRSRWKAALCLGAALAGAGAIGGWSAVAQPDWRAGMAWTVWLLAAVAAFRAWRHRASGCLHWDGEHWTLAVAGTTRPVGAVAVTLDLQSLMLVRWTPLEPGRGGWLWLEAWRQPLRWGDVRRAVYSRASNDALREPDQGFRADAAP